MRIYGKRTDGCLLISLGGGVGVIMRGTHATKPLDLQTLFKTMGPWGPVENTLDERRAAVKQLERCKTIAISNFNLGVTEGMSFDERRDRVQQALCQRLGIPSNSMYGPTMYIPQNGMGDDWVVYCTNGKHYGLGYSIDESSGAVAFDGSPEEVTQSWETLSDREDYDAGIELKSSFWKNFAKAKKAKKEMMDELPGSLPNVNKTY